MVSITYSLTRLGQKQLEVRRWLPAAALYLSEKNIGLHENHAEVRYGPRCELKRSRRPRLNKQLCKAGRPGPGRPTPRRRPLASTSVAGAAVRSFLLRPHRIACRIRRSLACKPLALASCARFAFDLRPRPQHHLPLVALIKASSSAQPAGISSKRRHSLL